MKTFTQTLEPNLKCGICGNEIIDRKSSYHSKFIPCSACERCRSIFSEKDIEIMLNMFLAYGGYFGQLSEKHFSLESYWEKIGIKQNLKTEETEELKVLILHTLLLHGITLQKYFHLIK